MNMHVSLGAVETVLQLTQSAETTYYKLILLVGKPGTQKTSTLCAVAEKLNSSVINVGLELSSKLLPMTIRQRVLRIPEVLADLTGPEHNAIVMNHTEILFDNSLQQDPLRLLKRISRNQLVIAAWGGVLENGKLTYAEPDHAEFRQYSISDFFVIDMNTCL